MFGLYGAGDTGSGQHIAVFELEPFAMSDLQTFDTCYFGATQAAAMLGRVHVVNVDGGQPAGAGSGEAILDIQDVSAFAPGANIDVYQAPNTTFGSLDEYAQIVNDNVDKIVTSSWGLASRRCSRARRASSRPRTSSSSRRPPRGRPSSRLRATRAATTATRS